MGLSIRHKGDFKKFQKYLTKIENPTDLVDLNKYGQMGVAALAAATPVDTGKTAASWNYEIIRDSKSVKLTFNNSNVNNGVNIAVILQFGHGTRNGGYVAGRDYINPAIQPIFDAMAQEAWKEVTRA